MRIVHLAFFLMIPVLANAANAPTGQIAIGDKDVLRGEFTEDHQMTKMDEPVHTSGHFVLAPAHGLIWGMEKPLQTATIVTSVGVVQDMGGGLTLKLPIRNFHHLYEMVGGALAGNWDGLAKDYVLTCKGTEKHWHMLLTPRHGIAHSLPYTSITVDGGRYVENIVMMKADGTSDAFAFTNIKQTAAPPTGAEIVSFNKASQ